MTAGRIAQRALQGVAFRADTSPRARRNGAAAGGHSYLPRRLWQKHATALSIVFGVVLALVLRAPWADAGLGHDEGGVAMIARAWHGGGEFPYGDHFLDRPPLLVALYRLAGATPAGIRVLGAVAACLLVVLTTLLAVRLAGRRAAPWAACITALLASSIELKSVYTPAELLAVVPSCASLLLLVTAIERTTKRYLLFAAAGVLATMALLVKQSFGDALAAGAVAVIAAKAFGWSWRQTARAAAAYAGGVAAALLGLVVWALAEHTSAHAVWYAMFGFRLDAVHALTGPGTGNRVWQLEPPLVKSGLLLALVFAGFGVAKLKKSAVVRLTLGAWVLAASLGILLGGSYWHHYLIALVPAAAAGAAAIFGRYRLIGALAVCAIAGPALLTWANVARSDSPDGVQQRAIALGHYVRARSQPGQSLYVMYAQVNTEYYANMRDPFPYNWSLMMRSVPHAQDRLRRLLASPSRPTWVAEAQHPHAFGLDRSGATKRLLTRHYRVAATVCGTPLLLAKGAKVLPAPPAPDCGASKVAFLSP